MTESTNTTPDIKSLNISDLIDIAYEVARENFGKEVFSFQSIWSKTWKKASDFNKEKVENWIGNFYTELLLDPRFVLFNFNTWKLKEFMTFGEMKKLDKTIFEKGLDVDEIPYEELVEAQKQEEGEIVEISEDDGIIEEPEEKGDSDLENEEGMENDNYDEELDSE